MLLLATSDDPDRRDAADAEAPAPESLTPASLEPEQPESEPPPEHPADEAPRRTEPLADPEPEAPPEQPPPEPSGVGPAEPSGEVEGAPPGPPPSTPLDARATEPTVGSRASAPQLDAVPPTAEAMPSSPVEPSAQPGAPAPPPPETDRPSEPAATKRSPLQRVALTILIIAAAALIGYVLSRPSGREADTDALVRSLDAAGRLQLRLETDTPAEARRYVRDEFGWRVAVPVFEAVPLRGVAIALTAPAVEVPVFLYADAEDRNVAVFAYSYALLDQVPDRLRLTTADYDDLAEGAPFVRRADGNEVLVWRDRDDIYIAVTDLPPDALTGGLAMAR